MSDQLHFRRNEIFKAEPQTESMPGRYYAGEELVDLCSITNTPPCLLLRRLLEQPPLSLNRQAYPPRSHPLQQLSCP